MKKYNADVPINASGERRCITKYTLTIGPPELATVDANPAPAPNTEPCHFCGGLCSISCRMRGSSTLYRQYSSTITPIVMRIAASYCLSNPSSSDPSATPKTVPGSSSRTTGQFQRFQYMP